MSTNAVDVMRFAVLDLATSRAYPRDRLIEVVRNRLCRVDESSLADAELAGWLGRIRSYTVVATQRPGACAVEHGVSLLADDEVDILLLQVVDLFEAMARDEQIRLQRRPVR